MILVDVHEPERIKKLADEVRELGVDVMIVGSHRKYAIERKTDLDLWNSTVDGRLWRQLVYLEKCREDGYIPLLLVEGNLMRLLKVVKGMTPIKFIGMQVALSSFGVTVVQVPKREYTEIFILYLEQKAGRPRSYERPNIPKPEDRTLEEERIDILRAIKGIGTKTAEALLAEFGTPLGAFIAEEEELRKILKSKTDHFLRVIGRYGVLVGSEGADKYGKESEGDEG